MPAGAARSGVDGGDGQRGFFQHIQQNPDGVQRGKQRHVMLRGNPADFYAVPAAGAGVTGVDDVGNVSLTQGVGDFVAAVADLAQNV